MTETITKILLICFAVGIVLVSVVYPFVILENNFLKKFINHEVLSALIVMVTVTLPVGMTLIEKTNKNKEIISEYKNITDEKKELINIEYDDAISRIKTGLKYLVLFLMLSILFLILAESTATNSDEFRSFLKGSVLYMFVHSIVLMYEMYRAMYDFWTPKEQS